MRTRFQSIKLTLILAIGGTLILAFSLGGWLSLHVLKSKLLEAYGQHRIELAERVAGTLADPIANFSPQSGRLVIEAIKQDPHVVSVQVYDSLNDMNFVQLNFPSRASEMLFENTVDVMQDGQRLGTLTMVFNDTAVMQEMAEKRLLVIRVFSVVCLVTIVTMYFLLTMILFRPLQKLSRQAQNLRHNELDHPVEWSRRDEISIVGRTLEGARTSIRSLIAELEQKGETFRVLSETDRLTKLANRHKLDMTLNSEIERRGRSHAPFGIILIDIDHFKSTNDTWGHDVGDLVLVAFADLLRTSTRETDLVGRWGGEEFLVITLEETLEGLQALAEKIRRKIETAEFPVVGHKTASLGAALHLEGEGVSQLIGRADAALYEAKRCGRNKSAIAASPSPNAMTRSRG